MQRGGRAPGKIAASLDAKLQSVEWGEYRLGDLFEKIDTQKLKYKTSELPDIPKGDYVLPALTAGIQNQGLNNYVPYEGATVLSNVISISANGANTGATFYQSGKFTVLQDAYAINWIYNNDLLTDAQYLFLTAAISKTVYGNYEWTNKAGWERIKNDTIQLPTRNGTIDFDFMETFIAELEAQRIAELEAYLTAAGLKDCTLTAQEEEALRLFEATEWGEYRLGDLFEVKSNPQLDKSSFVFSEHGEYPYFTRTIYNNGILGNVDYLDEEHKIKGGCLAVGMISMQFFYMEKDFYAGQFTKRAIPKDFILTKKLANFFAAVMNKYSSTYQNVLVRDFEKTFNESTINIPTKSTGAIDYAFMQTFISAIQKLVIRDVAAYSDRKMAAVRQAVTH